MKPIFLLLLVSLFLSSPLLAQDEVTDLSFWSIASSDFHADKPRPISIPGVGGRIDYYWYWTFKFRYRTNLEVLKNNLDVYRQKLEDGGSSTEEVKRLKNSIDRIELTIKKIENENDETKISDDETITRLEKLRWQLKLSIILRTDTGQVLPDLSSGVVRNLVERENHQQYYTTLEIKSLSRKDVPETVDPEHGRGRWVHGVAIFTGMQSSARELELRVAGLGYRLKPTFTQGQLIYNQEAAAMENSADTTARRTLVFDYRKIGQSGEAHLDNIQFEKRAVAWVWAWALQIYPGRFREIELTRDPELDGVEAIKRRYVYFPYFIWNSTGNAQSLTVEHAGFAEDIKWGGEKIRVTIYDDGGTAARWKNQARQEIINRLASGNEKMAVEEFEMYPVSFTDVPVEEYYREHFDGLAYTVEGAQSGDIQEKAKAFSGKLQEALAVKKTADLERKSTFTVAEENRLFKGEIPAGKIVNGVAIMQWGITDVEVLIDDLIANLQSKALLKVVPEEQPLLAEYLKLRRPPVDANREWTELSEPPRLAIVEMLAKLAEKDLGEKEITISEDDAQRYGAAAPFAVLFNHLAWEKLQARAEKGITDAYFRARLGKVISSAYVAAQFQRYLPNERKAIPPREDPLKGFGSRESIGKAGSTDNTRPDGTGEKSAEGDDWE